MVVDIFIMFGTMEWVSFMLRGWDFMWFIWLSEAAVAFYFLFPPLWVWNTQTHTHTSMYIYIYVNVYIYICKCIYIYEMVNVHVNIWSSAGGWAARSQLSQHVQLMWRDMEAAAMPKHCQRENQGKWLDKNDWLDNLDNNQFHTTSYIYMKSSDVILNMSTSSFCILSASKEITSRVGH